MRLLLSRKDLVGPRPLGLRLAPRVTILAVQQKRQSLERATAAVAPAPDSGSDDFFVQVVAATLWTIESRFLCP